MPILRERNDLDKKWTWYLFLLANVSVLIGAAATWMMVSRNGANLNLLWLPIVICNLIAIVLTVVFMFLEAKEIAPKAMHFQKKWLWWYLAALIVFVVAIIFVATYFVLAIQSPLENYPSYLSELRGDKKWVLIVFFVITGVLTLVSIGLQRFSRYKIDLDVLKRKHGENPKAKEEKKIETKATKKHKPYGSDEKATGGLLDEIDKK